MELSRFEKPNYNGLSLLISEYNPSVFFFQETLLKPDDNISLKGFNIYNYVHTDCRVAQSVTCLATDESLTTDPGVVSSIPAGPMLSWRLIMK